METSNWHSKLEEVYSLSPIVLGLIIALFPNGLHTFSVNLEKATQGCRHVYVMTIKEIAIMIGTLYGCSSKLRAILRKHDSQNQVKHSKHLLMQ